jgi:hypothetical protein
MTSRHQRFVDAREDLLRSANRVRTNWGEGVRRGPGSAWHAVCKRARMSGITNRPESLENENQQRVEARKDELPDFEVANRPRKDHPLDKDRSEPLEDRGRPDLPGIGQGAEHKGH